MTEHGSVVRKRGERLVVEKDGRELLEVELRRLSAVLMLESVQVTTAALVQMLNFGVEFAILSGRGKLLGQLTPPSARNIPLRKAQFKRETDPEFARAQSRVIVEAKVHNSVEVLKRYVWDEPGQQPEIQRTIARLQNLHGKIRQAESRDELLGLEGSVAAAYWSCFGSMLKVDGIAFDGRKRRPPPDPVNAVLSFGYVLLTNALQSLLDGMGFDPFLGFFHEEDYGRPSLALDLLEPFRAPVVDRFAVRVFNLGILKPDDFQTDADGGRRLTRPAMRVFFKHWEAHLTKMRTREELRKAGEQLARVFLGEEAEIKPYLWTARS